MTLTLFETIQQIVRDELRQVRTAELGVVQEVHLHGGDSDKDNHSCTVRLRDSGLVLKGVPVATARIGTSSLPREGELVLVQFVGGDVNAPVVTGCLYSEEHRPPVNAGGRMVWHLPNAAGESDAMHVELLSQDERQVALTLGSGLKLNLRDGDPAVELDVKDGKAKVTIKQDGAVTVESQGDFNIKSAGKINVEATGNLTLKGALVDINP